MFNTTVIQRNNDIYYNVDRFPSSYDEEDFELSSVSSNHSYYDDFLSDFNHTLNKINSSTILSLSSPITYIIFIVMVYLILTIILLAFSIYKKRRVEMENFYLGDTDEDIAQEKRLLAQKKLLIGKIKKGDMEPLLSDVNNHQINTTTFPSHIV